MLQLEIGIPLSRLTDMTYNFSVEQTLFRNLLQRYSPDMASAVASQWAGVTITACNQKGSYPALPLRFKQDGLHRLFFIELWNAYDKRGDEVWKMLPTLDDTTWVVRMDDAGFWTLFNKQRLSKLRINLAGTVCLPVASIVPERLYVSLVGNFHEATTTSIIKLIHDAAKAEIFEINFVGEPVLYPEFHNALKLCLDSGITPSFSSNNIFWMEEPWAGLALFYSGGFTYKVISSKNVTKLAGALQGLNYPSNKVSVAYTLGSTTPLEFRKIADAAYVNGFSLIINGAEDSKWIEQLIKFRKEGKTLSVLFDDDTKEVYGRKVQFNNAGSYILPLNPGVFSCFINLATDQIAPSEYSVRGDIQSFNSTWLETYKTFL